MTFVEPPALFDRNPQLVEHVERDTESLDRAAKHRRVREVEHESALTQQPARLFPFREAALRQVHVGPTRKPVLLIPSTLAVA